MTVLFSSLLKANLKFSLKSVNFKAAGKYTPPDCYKFEIMVNMYFKNIIVLCIIFLLIGIEFLNIIYFLSHNTTILIIVYIKNEYFSSQKHYYHC